MTEQQRPGEQIVDQATSWPGVDAQTGDRGELSLRVDGRELGHLHGDRSAHFVFPKPLWAELFEQERIDYHPVFPGRPGFAARSIDTAEDVRDVVELLRLNYDRLVARHGQPAEV